MAPRLFRPTLPTLSENRLARMGTLCVLYVAQGIPFGFVTGALKTYLADQNVGAGEIGTMIAMISWPWALKWIWGPVIDRFRMRKMGRRRPWILIAQSLMMLTIIAMALVSDITTGVRRLAWMILIHNVFAALQDVSVDALAVDLIPDGERGRANGFMFGSAYVGRFIGGSGLGLGYVLFNYGFHAALIAQVLLLGIILLVPLLMRERPGDRFFFRGQSKAGDPTESDQADLDGSRSIKELFRNAARAFSLRSTILCAIFAILSQVGISMLSIVAAVFVQKDLGWSKEEYLAIDSGYGVWFGFGACILGGFLADRVGPRRAVVLSSMALGFLWIGFRLGESLWEKPEFVTAFLLTEMSLGGFLSVSMFALFMKVSWPRVAATQFSAYMAMLNLSIGAGGQLAGFFTDHLTIPQIYLVLGICQIAMPLILLPFDPGQARRVLGEE